MKSMLLKYKKCLEFYTESRKTKIVKNAYKEIETYMETYENFFYFLDMDYEKMYRDGHSHCYSAIITYFGEFYLSYYLIM